MLLAGSSALLSVEIPAIPIKSKKLIMTSACQLDRRNLVLIGVYNPDSPPCQLLFQRSWVIPVCTSCWTSLSALLESIWVQSVILCSLTSEHLRECSVHAVIYLRTWVCCFCETEETLSWACFQSSLQELGCLITTLLLHPTLQRMCCGP